MPVPKHARPTTHRTSRSANRSRRGRGEGVVAPGIVLHRSEKFSTRYGSFAEVHLIGVSEHADLVRQHVLRLKYGKQKHIARELAGIVHCALLQLAIVPPDVVVTWAPTTDRRVQRRGFDQAELIARHLGVLLGVRTLRLLRRTSEQTQTGHLRRERLANPSFTGRGRARCHAVVVVDDVVTTGSTLRRAAEQLANDGYSLIICIAPSHQVSSQTFSGTTVSSSCLMDRNGRRRPR